MKTQRFNPAEILFCPTTHCNLRCAHCDTGQRRTVLALKTGLRFLNRCADAGIKRVGFTGGEPFLALDFLCAITKEAVRLRMLFSRIMTNAGWFRSKRQLISALNRLFDCGYDGEFCVSVDAFHRQGLRQAASFISAAAAIWRRPDIVSIASVKGAGERQTGRRLTTLARRLNARLSDFPKRHACIKNAGLFIRILPIDLSAVGKAARLKNPWDGKWFRDDFCRGPGNVFFVLADGRVKPCCGYAADTDILTIGNIKRDTPRELMRNAADNPFISAVFGCGLHPLRKRLQRCGVSFPGKTTNHCVFCDYLTRYLPRALLNECLTAANKSRNGR